MTSTNTQEKPAVTVKDLAVKLGTDPRQLRTFIRGLDSELKVGRGGRYAWASMSDPAVKKISTAWKRQQEA